ncbi:MAG: hypothetical protein QOI30_2205, partial [Mycobacterium sp.]|nr:hypothetical protein [Mycobacterium sp.]
SRVLPVANVWRSRATVFATSVPMAAEVLVVPAAGVLVSVASVVKGIPLPPPAKTQS